QRDVEVVSAGGSGVGSRSVRSNPVTKRILLPLEFAFSGLLLGKLCFRTHGAISFRLSRCVTSQDSPRQPPSANHSFHRPPGQLRSKTSTCAGFFAVMSSVRSLS